MSKPEMQKLSLELTPDQHGKLKTISKINDRDMVKQIRHWIETTYAAMFGTEEEQINRLRNHKE